MEKAFAVMGIRDIFTLQTNTILHLSMYKSKYPLGEITIGKLFEVKIAWRFWGLERNDMGLWISIKESEGLRKRVLA